MLKKILLKLTTSIIKILQPILFSFLVFFKVNRRVINYLSEKSFFSNNKYNFFELISSQLDEKKIISLDIGAQGGFNSDKFFPDKYNKFFNPILVEPLREEADKLKSNNKHVIDKGIWSEKVKKKIYVLGNRLGSSSMYAPDPSFFNVHKIKKKNYSDYNVTKVLEVECDNISNSLNELKIENLDYLKIDTQGSEFEILKGIGNYRPLLIKIEVHLYSMYKSAPGWDKLISYLYDLGYMIVDWKGIGSHATRTPAEMDMVFIPNFNSSFGKKLITANKEKFISLMLIFGQINLLKIISEKYHFKDSDEIQMIEDRYFN
jgi:FkbM family methyltransferase